MSTDDRALRDQLVELLRGSNAHADVKTVFADFPADLAGKKPKGAPHTAWQQLEHLRIALHDILDFSTNSEYLEMKFPDDYWPEEEAPASGDAWKQSVAAVEADLQDFEDLVNDPDSNLYAQIPWGSGQTLLREVLLAADHNSYHLGQIVYLRKQLGAWKS
jgi:uncharacterized damage-inducible protein DinB